MRARFKAPSGKVLLTWILLLAGAQLADVMTTGVDMAHGGVEANRVVASLMALGGLGLVFALKLLLVGAMATACLVLKRCAVLNHSLQARAAHAFVWRSTQLSVLGLLVVSAHNAALLAQIS